MKKISLTLLILLAVLLSACQPEIAPTPTNTAADDNQPAQPEPAAGDEPAEPTAPPAETSEYGDRAIYAAGLIPEARDILKQYPDASEYHISVEIPDDLTNLIYGAVSVHYTNQETVPLEEIYFRLFPPVYGGTLDVTNVQVNGAAAETTLESDNTALRVALPEALAVGDSVDIALDFALGLPATLDSSYGLLGYFGETLTLDTFYPMIPAYDEDYGWYTHIPYPNGDLTYQDMSFYQVDVSAPEDFVMAASGVEVGQTVNDGMKTVSYVIGPARDFYIAGSYEYSVLSQEVNGVMVNSYGKSDYGLSQEIALNAGVNAISKFSEFLGQYPYTEFDIVNSPMLAYGVEYPGITNIFQDLYYQALEESPDGRSLTTLEMVIVHEAGHQWFYNLVGNDQQEHPWLDESTTQYITYLYVYHQYGDFIAETASVGNWKGRMQRINNEAIPIGLPSGEYHGAEYSGIVYGRGPLFFLELEDIYGQDVVVKALHDYFQEQEWEIGTEAELRASLEDACACDLSEMFADWIDE